MEPRPQNFFVARKVPPVGTRNWSQTVGRGSGHVKVADDGPDYGSQNAKLGPVQTFQFRIAVVDDVYLFTTLNRHVVNLPRR